MALCPDCVAKSMMFSRELQSNFRITLKTCVSTVFGEIPKMDAIRLFPLMWTIQATTSISRTVNLMLPKLSQGFVEEFWEDLFGLS